MHRSGTSYLAGALSDAGLFLGDRNQTGSPFNAKGNQENQRIVIFHETVLKAAGGSWDAPPDRIRWETRHRERAMQLAAAYPADRLCGFKDPRTLLHWHEWQTLPIHWQPVGIFRHPQACAASLQTRDGMPASKAIALWHTYNQHLLTAWQAHPFPLVDFDQPAIALQHDVQRVANWLGLSATSKIAFFEPALRHTTTRTDTRTDTAAERLHRQLQDAAESFWTLPEATTDSN
jgi:hypothetical protein